jgi:hypothetical protein
MGIGAFNLVSMTVTSFCNAEKHVISLKWDMLICFVSLEM